MECCLLAQQGTMWVSNFLQSDIWQGPKGTAAVAVS